MASTVQTTYYRKCTVKLQTVPCSQGQSCNGCAKNLPHSLPLLSLLSITVKYSPKGGGVDERRNGRLFFPPNLSIMFFRTSFRARAQSSVCTCESHTGSAGCFRFPFSGIVHSVPACCVRSSSIFIENAVMLQQCALDSRTKLENTGTLPKEKCTTFLSYTPTASNRVLCICDAKQAPTSENCTHQGEVLERQQLPASHGKTGIRKLVRTKKVNFGKYRRRRSNFKRFELQRRMPRH